MEEDATEPVELLDDGIDDLLDAWGDLQLLGGINKDVMMQDYMVVDADVITGWFGIYVLFLCSHCRRSSHSRGNRGGSLGSGGGGSQQCLQQRDNGKGGTRRAGCDTPRSPIRFESRPSIRGEEHYRSNHSQLQRWFGRILLSGEKEE